MSLIRLGGKGRTLLGSVQSGQVYFSKRGHVTLPGELPGLVAHSSEVSFDRETQAESEATGTPVVTALTIESHHSGRLSHWRFRSL